MSQRRSRDDSHFTDAGSRRPASIGELAERAMKFDWDSSRDFKHCLRMAESSRNQARSHQNTGDLESAFILYARAATIALEKLPAHPQYMSALTDAQRDNLGLNGQDILDSMGGIKPVLVDRFNEWRTAHPDDPLLPLPDDQDPRQGTMTAAEFGKALKEEAAAWREWRENHEREAGAERLQRQRQIEEDNLRRQSSRHRTQPQRQPTLDRRKQDSIRHPQAAYKPPTADYTFSQLPPNHGHGSQNTKVVVMPPADPESSQWKREKEEKRRAEQEGIARRQQEADAEARQIRQTIAVNNALPHPPQQQGSLSTHSSVSSVATNGSSPMFPHTQASSLATTPASSFYQVPPQISMPPQPVIHPQPPPPQSVPPPLVSMFAQQAPPPPNPVTPVRTQQMAPGRIPPIVDQQQQPPYHPGSESPTPPYLFPGSNQATLHRTPTRATFRGQISQGFFSTTSPPPQDPRALFPSLMSPHQQQQGYYPSHHSMFTSLERLTLNDTTNTTAAPSFDPNSIYAPSGHPPPTWAFGSQESTKSAAAAAAAQVGQRMMDGGTKLSKSGTMKYHNPAPPPLPTPPPPPGMGIGMGAENVPASSVSGVPYIPMPPPPPNSASATQTLSAGGRIPPPHPHQRQHQQLNQHRDRHHPGSSPKEKKLKTVVLPREVLPRFLAIASLNTSMNVETCGLLLGREVWGDDNDEYRHNRNGNDNKQKEGGGEGMSEYMVTTMLVPKQRGTSDTCTMDGEELVLEFVDQRSLITLGWIHTHPSQSCFMSSVDLHTHSGFQKMLPESVAVVCAPKSNPNFGIFRLTDPPGLPTILGCKEKEAFHPHPDLPIYTDADKGHVLMRDSPLEIIDMR